MNKKVEFEEIKKRRILKQKFEQSTIIKLQDEEINRLKNELQTLKRVIKEKKVQKRKERSSKSPKKSKQSVADSLKQKIAATKLDNKKKRIEERKSHQNYIKDMNDRHLKLLFQMRKEYEAKIKRNKSKKGAVTDDMLTIQIIRNIDRTNADIQRTLNKGAEKRDKMIKNALETEKAKIEKLRQRETDLKNAIQQEKEKIIEGRNLNELRVINAKKAIREKMNGSLKVSANIEEKLIIENAKQIATLNELTEKEMDRLGPLRASVRIQKKRFINESTKIRDLKAKFAKELDDIENSIRCVNVELEESESLHEPLKEKIKTAEKQCVKAEQNVYSLRSQLEMKNDERNDIYECNVNIMNEIIRLDNQLFGKGGKYQKGEYLKEFSEYTKEETKKRKRPFVPVGGKI